MVGIKSFIPQNSYLFHSEYLLLFLFKFKLVAPQKSRLPVLMDEETSSNVLAKSEQIVPENEISTEDKKLRNTSLEYSEDLLVEDNQAIAMSIEDEKPIKVSTRKESRDKSEFGSKNNLNVLADIYNSYRKTH